MIEIILEIVQSLIMFFLLAFVVKIELQLREISHFPPKEIKKRKPPKDEEDIDPEMGR